MRAKQKSLFEQTSFEKRLRFIRSRGDFSWWRKMCSTRVTLHGEPRKTKKKLRSFSWPANLRHACFIRQSNTIRRSLGSDVVSAFKLVFVVVFVRGWIDEEEREGENAQRNSGVMRLSCSGVLFPLSIRGGTALLLAIVPTSSFESPSRGTAFVPFAPFVFHQLSRHQLRCYLSPLSYLSAVIKYLKLHLPSK